MDWDKLRIFHAVADAGSLTHAGDSLGLSQSAVSRQIRGLEESLGTTLFHRHARGLILTEQGELLFDATSSMNRRLETAMETAWRASAPIVHPAGDETLARDRPALLVEIEERHHPGESARVFAHLGARDYDGFFLLGGALRPVAEFDPARHQRPEDIKRPGAPRSQAYINNFLFLPREDAALRQRVGV